MGADFPAPTAMYCDALIHCQLVNFEEVPESINHYAKAIAALNKVMDDHTLVALTIMIAESRPEEKEMMISGLTYTDLVQTYGLWVFKEECQIRNDWNAVIPRLTAITCTVSSARKRRRIDTMCRLCFIR